MKILLVANGYPPEGLGGVEVYCRDLAHSLRPRGHDVRVFCRRSNLALPDYHTSTAFVDGVEVTRIVNDHKHSVSLRDTFIDANVETIFRAHLQQVQPEVVHFNHLIGLSARLPAIAAELGIPYLITLHDYWPICPQIRLVDWQGQSCLGPHNGGDCAVCLRGGHTLAPLPTVWTRWLKTVAPAQARRRIRERLFPNRSIEAQPTALAFDRHDLEDRMRIFREAVLPAAHILVPSDFVRRQYAANGYPGKRIEALPLGIDIPTSPGAFPRATPALIFGCVGSLIPAKGIHILIQAFRQTVGDALRLHLYGRQDADPAYERELQRLAAPDDRIEFMGPFAPEQRPRVYAAMDVYVQPSLFPETFSLAAREALASGKPVLASRIGALPEIVIHGVNGFLFAPGNIPELTEILTGIAGDPGRLARLDVPGPNPILSLADHAGLIEARYRDSLQLT